MSARPTGYVEHVAILVADIHWHIRFFEDVLNMTFREVQGTLEEPEQYWTLGGMQLRAAPDFKGPEGRFLHLGIMVDDLDAALERAAAYGVTTLPHGRNWILLPDNLELELIQAAPGAVAAVRAVDPRLGMDG
ncbi:VOC family protein [Novosphingobium terrae]|uniref:VOC family protein n=1 Tax=Novosphingobium terrae TaxID=2726189 RepID=UPI00197CC001|nr:VOC family protein [Novosphingobium terrae]